MTQEEESFIEGIIGESLEVQEIFQENSDRIQGIEEEVIEEEVIPEGMIEEKMIGEEVIPERMIEEVSQEKIIKESMRAA